MLPFVVGAQFGEIDNFILRVSTFINNIIVPFVFVIAFLVFIIGVVRYFVAGAADEEKRSAARSLALWGIGGLVLISVVWGVVNVLANGLGQGLDENVDRPDSIPSVPVGRS